MAKRELDVIGGFRKLYAPLSYHDIQTRLLGEVKTKLQVKLDSRLCESLWKVGRTLAIDGWSSVTSLPFVNAMLVNVYEIFLNTSMNLIEISIYSDFARLHK